MKILFTNDTKDCIEFNSYTDIEDVLKQLMESKNLLQDVLTSGNSIVIQGDKL